MATGAKDMLTFKRMNLFKFIEEKAGEALANEKLSISFNEP